MNGIASSRRLNGAGWVRAMCLGVGVLGWWLNAGAAQVTLAWDPNLETGIAGYKLYYGTSTTYPGTGVNCGNVTNYTLANLEPGRTYFFHATCYNTSGLESEPSNVVEYTVPISGNGAPEVSGLRVTAGGLEMQWTATPGTTYRVLYKTDLNQTTWTLLDEFLVDGTSGYFVDAAFGTGPRRFYKLEVAP